MKTNRAHLLLTLIFSFAAASTSLHAASISGQGTWETTLQGRDVDGNPSNGFEAYYDTALNITWTGNANINGLASWNNQMNWVNNFTLGGVTDWRLTRVIDTGTVGCNSSFSNTDCGWNVDPNTGELAHLFYITLGNSGQFDTAGNIMNNFPAPINTGPFINFILANLGNGEFFTGTNYLPTNLDAWAFGFVGGTQDYIAKEGLHAAWAVHDGDIFASTVPIPATIWLFGSGLLGLIGFAKKRKA